MHGIAQGTLLEVMGQLGWQEICGRMDTCICMAESLPCSPETITTLFVNWRFCCCCFSVTKLCPILQPYELQHAGFLCPSLSLWVCSNKCPLRVMTFNHLILCCPLFLLPSIFPIIRAFSNESALHIRWPNYWRFSFSISPHNWLNPNTK